MRIPLGTMGARSRSITVAGAAEPSSLMRTRSSSPVLRFVVYRVEIPSKAIPLIWMSKGEQRCGWRRAGEQRVGGPSAQFASVGLHGSGVVSRRIRPGRRVAAVGSVVSVM
jgi:hypothetical protein